MRRIRVLSVGVVLAAAVSALSGLPATAGTAVTPSTASGTISRADGASPQGIIVLARCFEEFRGQYVPDSARAAADGTYTVSVPECDEGAAMVEFHDPRGTYAAQFYRAAGEAADRTLVPHADGDTALEPQTMSHRAGTIRGRIFNTYGHPVRDRALRVTANCCDEVSDSTRVLDFPVGPRGGYRLLGLTPGTHHVYTHDTARYAGGVGRAPRGVRVAAGKVTTAPRLVLKDRARIHVKTTWRPGSVTVRMRVSSGLTGRPAAGRVALQVMADASPTRNVRLRHGRAVVTMRVRHSTSAIVSLDYHGSRHVGSRLLEREYDF